MEPGPPDNDPWAEDHVGPDSQESPVENSPEPHEASENRRIRLRRRGGEVDEGGLNVVLL